MRHTAIVLVPAAVALTFGLYLLNSAGEFSVPENFPVLTAEEIGP